MIPVQPLPFDVWSCNEIAELIEEGQQVREGLTANFVINRRIGKTVIGRDVRKAFEQFNFPVFEKAVSQRVVFAEAAAQGLTVIETDPDSEAASEIAAIAEGIMKIKQERKAT